VSQVDRFNPDANNWEAVSTDDVQLPAWLEYSSHSGRDTFGNRVVISPSIDGTTKATADTQTQELERNHMIVSPAGEALMQSQRGLLSAIDSALQAFDNSFQSASSMEALQEYAFLKQKAQEVVAVTNPKTHQEFGTLRMLSKTGDLGGGQSRVYELQLKNGENFVVKTKTAVSNEDITIPYSQLMEMFQDAESDPEVQRVFQEQGFRFPSILLASPQMLIQEKIDGPHPERLQLDGSVTEGGSRIRKVEEVLKSFLDRNKQNPLWKDIQPDFRVFFDQSKLRFDNFMLGKDLGKRDYRNFGENFREVILIDPFIKSNDENRGIDSVSKTLMNLFEDEY